MRLRYALLPLVALIVLVGVSCAPRAIDATRLGLDLAKGGNIDADALASRELVAYEVQRRAMQADLYRPRRRAAEGENTCNREKGGAEQADLRSGGAHPLPSRRT